MPSGHQGVEHARAIEVPGQPVPPGHLADGSHIVPGVAAAAAAVVRVFEAHEAGGGVVHVLGPNGGFDLCGREAAPVAGQQRHRGARVEGNAAHFPQVHVGRLLADNLAQRLGVGLDGNLVGHGARGAKQAGFEAEAGGGHFLEAAHGGVFFVHVVADGGREHGRQHRRRRARYGIGAQVDEGQGRAFGRHGSKQEAD
ncbi:MAG: hypothetical protein NVS3B25_13550 [Hymenobacter sp.]